MKFFGPEPGSRAAFDYYIHSLIATDWESAACPLNLACNLKLDEMGAAEFVLNARRFLAALDAADEIPATATGNLNRKFVKQMFDEFTLSKRYRESMLQVCKVINEMDLWTLHIVRVVCELAGLVSRRKKAFHLTRAGRELLPESCAGGLFRKLFLTYFRQFDLHYDFPLRAVPGIQETMAVILWRLEAVAQDWVPVPKLPDLLLLPPVHQQLRAAMVSEFDSESWILAGYVLSPLREFGLLERQPDNEWGIDEKSQVRTSALWRKLIRFEYPVTGDVRNN